MSFHYLYNHSSSLLLRRSIPYTVIDSSFPFLHCKSASLRFVHHSVDRPQLIASQFIYAYVVRYSALVRFVDYL